MKKHLSVLLAGCLVLSLAACGNSSSSTAAETSAAIETEAVVETTEAVVETTEAVVETEAETVTEAETLSEEDAVWDQLEALGKIETDNGIFTVTITLPAALAGEDVTQDQLDEEAGEEYLSATLNEDGSVTYKMTKEQHKSMMQTLTDSVDSVLQDLVDDDDYAYTEIKHNDDFTQYDAVLSTSEVGIGEELMVYAFDVYSGWYGCFTGVYPDSVIVNYFDQDGNLLNSYDSADTEDEE